MTSKEKTVSVETSRQVSLNRILPENPEAEIAVLEAIFAGPEGIKIARKILNPEDFTRITGRNIFKRMCKFDDDGRGFNITTLDQSFEDDPDHFVYSNTLIGLYPVTTSIISHFAKIILENSLRRKIIKVAEKMQEMAFNQSVPIQVVLDELESTTAEVKLRMETKI